MPSWKLALRADRKSPQTIDAYTTGARLFLDWCDKNGHTPALDRNLVRAWVTHLLADTLLLKHRRIWPVQRMQSF